MVYCPACQKEQQVEQEKLLNTWYRRLEDQTALYYGQEDAQWWPVCTTCTVCIVNACSLEKVISVVLGTPK